MGAIDTIPQELARRSSGTDRGVEQRLRRVVRLLFAVRYLCVFCGAVFIAWEAYEILWLRDGIRPDNLVEIVMVGVLGPVLVWVTSTWVGRLADELAQSYWKLSASQEELGLHCEVVANMAEGVYLIRTRDGVIVYVNSKFEEMFGYKHGELIGKHVSVVNTPGEKTPEEVATEIIESLNENGVWSGEVHNIKKDGETFWCLASVSTFDHSEYGEIWVSVHTDITEHKAAEEALAYQAHLVENVSYAIIASDEKFVTMAWNRAAEEMYGWTAGEIIGRPTAEFLQPEFVDVEPDEVYRRLLEQGHFEGEVIHLRKDGTRIHTEARAMALWDKDGRNTGFVSIDRDITERKRAEEALLKSEEDARQLAQENAVLAEISRIVNSSLDLNTVYERIAEEVQKLIPFDRISIATQDLAAGTLTHEFVAGIEVPGWRSGDVLRISDSVSATMLGTGKATYIRLSSHKESDVKSHQEELARQAGLRSGISVPIVFDEEVIGGLSLRSTNQDAYSQRQLLLAERVGAQIAGAISNARFYGHLQHEADEREVLGEISRIIGSSLDINEVYASFAEQVRNIIPFDRMTICAVDMDRSTFSDLYHIGIDVPERRVGAEIPLAGSVTGEVCRLRSGLLIQGETEEQFAKDYPGTIPGFQAGIRSFLSVPLISKNEVTGVLHLRSAELNAFSDDHLALAERVAAQVAGAIANARLHSELDCEAREREALAEISRVMDSSLDINDVFGPFAEQVRKVIPFDRLGIGIPDLDQGFSITSYTTGMEVEQRKSGVSVPLDGTLAQKIILSRSGVLLQRVSREYLQEHLPGLLPNFDAGLRSFIGVPLIHHDDAIGVLQIRSREANAYTEKHLTLAERIGVQISGAFANSRLYTDLRRAEEALRKNEQRIRELATATVRAHEEERQWAAIEVHDRISQTLVGLVHNIHTLECMASGDSKMRQLASRASELLQQAIGESRNIMNYLYPPGLEEFGIVPLLKTDLLRFQEDTGSEVSLDADSEAKIPQVLKVTLYRIFQEALTNIRRHAIGTKMVTVSLRCADRMVSLEVRDDGAGFDVKMSTPEGQVGGLMIMSRRAEIIGGTLDISSTKGQGTTVTVRVPIDRGNL